MQWDHKMYARDADFNKCCGVQIMVNYSCLAYIALNINIAFTDNDGEWC